MTLRAGGMGRRTALAGAACFALMYALGGPVLAALPKPVLAGIMLMIAVALADRWTHQLVRQRRAGERSIEPTLVQNERTAARQPDGSYLARCVYSFPTKDVNGAARLSLVVREPDGQQVARFPIDLSRMR